MELQLDGSVELGAGAGGRMEPMPRVTVGVQSLGGEGVGVREGIEVWGPFTHYPPWVHMVVGPQGARVQHRHCCQWCMAPASSAPGAQGVQPGQPAPIMWGSLGHTCTSCTHAPVGEALHNGAGCLCHSLPHRSQDSAGKQGPGLPSTFSSVMGPVQQGVVKAAVSIVWGLPRSCAPWETLHDRGRLPCCTP